MAIDILYKASCTKLLVDSNFVPNIAAFLAYIHAD